MLRQRMLRPVTHTYLSTSCAHGLNSRCRRTCKYCAAPCVWPGHTDETIPPDTELRDRLRETVQYIDVGHGTHTAPDGTATEIISTVDLDDLGDNVVETLVDRILETLAGMLPREGPYASSDCPASPTG